MRASCLHFDRPCGPSGEASTPSLYRPLPKPLSSRYARVPACAQEAMKLNVMLLAFTGVLMFASSASPIEQPRIVPRSAHVDKSIEVVFNTLKTYFSDPALSMFRLETADAAKHTLVATRSGIDTESWTNWAFCKTGVAQMIYKFDDGSAQVTVQLEASGNSATFVTVTADFEGTYKLVSAENKVACISQGGLEQTILTVAGAPAGGSSH